MTDTQNTLLRDADGRLVSYAWPSGYPVLYLDSDNCTLCPDCATLADEDIRTRPVSAFIHYEGPDAICENCNEAIPSAYGDPEDD